MDNIELWCGDCLELMNDISDKSVDMILCDLPYGTTSCKWDIVIPFEPLWKQPEYSAILERVSLCDTVTIRHSALGITAEYERLLNVSHLDFRGFNEEV